MGLQSEILGSHRNVVSCRQAHTSMSEWEDQINSYLLNKALAFTEISVALR